MKNLNLVVFGTSLLWGQGLEEADKIHTLVGQKLQSQHQDTNVNVTFLAHSGASTGFNADGSVDTTIKPPLHGEVPTLYPSILQEIEAFDALGIPPESIDIILLDAGVNDVHITHILNPLATPTSIKHLTEIYCHQHMQLLVERLLTKFKNAKIIVLGYYEFITEGSEEEIIHTMLKAFGKLPGGFIADLVFEAVGWLIKRRLLKNCDVFVSQSLAAFQQVAKEVNKELAKDRVFVADIDFKAENAAFAADSWLFGINDDLSPQDPMAHIRVPNCQSAEAGRTKPTFCEKASICHPNPKGAQAYADAIMALL